MVFTILLLIEIYHPCKVQYGVYVKKSVCTVHLKQIRHTSPSVKEVLMDTLAAIFQTPLDMGLDTPLYQQLKQRILQLIATGLLSPDEPLPTEKQLCETFGLSRATINPADSITSSKGGGHGVALSFSSEMEDAGRIPSSRVLSLRKKMSSKGISQRLGIPDGTSVWEIKRLRLADNVPMQLAIAYVPYRLCPKLTKEDLESSLYVLIAKESGRLPAHAEEVYEAVCLDERTAKVLGTSKGTAAMRVLRTSYDTAGQPFEASVLIAPGDRDRLAVSLSPDGTEVRRVWG